MLGNGAAGAVGIVVQSAFFVVVALYAARSRGLSRGLLYGGVIAVYGYALVIAFLSLLGIPWQVTNVLLVLSLALFFARASARSTISGLLPGALFVLRRSWAAASVVGGVMAFTIFITALEADLSIDGQLYHGPVLANIVQSGSLWGWSAPNQYMYYTDLTMAGGVNLATFAGDARFDNAIQAPHLLLLILAIAWALGRRYRSSFARVSIATLIVASPVIWMQPRILYVDLAYGTAVAVAILMIAAVREFRILDVLIVGIAISAVFATKPAGILTGMILLGALAVAVFVRSGGLPQWRSSLGLYAAGVGPALVMGTSFYVRNWVAFANPVYPIRAAFGPVVFPGIIDLSVFASGERGSGLVDLGRLASYGDSLVRGMFHGVDKPDYDPRAGGFGHVPLAVLLLVLAVLGLGLLQRWRGPHITQRERIGWRGPLAMAGIVGAVLVVQPATFDTRYVIGPTVVLLTAALLVVVSVPLPPRVQVVAGMLALVAATGQIAWSEQRVYAGVKTSLDVMRGPAIWQPNSPAGLGSRQGLAVAWLPDDCSSIALETAGGVTESGMVESSYLGVLPYGLYGDFLCNEILPMTLDDGVDDAASLVGADFVVLYKDDVTAWAQEFPTTMACLKPIYEIAGSESYPRDELVFRNTCG
ncbi:MAG: hypothetical protein HGA51_00340 [Demequinaceae bacterium]|nr:hypothetical protein [Demequinaceae bacterium]